MIAYLIRHPTPDDQGFICDAWFKAARSASKASESIPLELYQPRQLAHMERALANARALVMCHPEDPTELIGFIVYHCLGPSLVIHWIYVRHMFRRQGLARELTRSVHPGARQLVFTQFARALPALLERGFAGLPCLFDPYSYDH